MRQGSWQVIGAAAACGIAVACAKSEQTVISSPDSGPIESGDAGIPDGSIPDAGLPDAGQPDAGQPDAGVTFGGPGPWSKDNVSYSWADGLDLSSPVVGFSTDETQNQWVATHTALYLMRPGDKTFHRYDANDGLHLQSNPVEYCDSNFSEGDRMCPIFGAASNPGIAEITGGGPNEVFVGYFGEHNWSAPAGDGTWADPLRHMGKVDRVRLQPDGKLEVVRFDMVSGNTPMFWHNRWVFRLVYDHFIHKHELYVGAEHGIVKISPDKWFEPKNKTWPYLEYLYWMSDHLHPHVCMHQWCTFDEGKDTQMMGGWAALAIAPDGDLWAGSFYSAGKLTYTELPAELNADGTRQLDVYGQPIPRSGSEIYTYNFGHGWCGSAGHVQIWSDQAGRWVDTPCSPGTGWPPVFPVPSPGDKAMINAVTVTPDNMVWWSSPTYGIARFDRHQFTYYTPGQAGTFGTVTDLVAGSGIEFADRGIHKLKGVPGDWQLFAVTSA